MNKNVSGASPVERRVRPRIERLRWYDAERCKPTHDGNVLLMVRSPQPFRTPTWGIGWWSLDEKEWMFVMEGAQNNVVLYWSDGPNGPAV